MSQTFLLLFGWCCLFAVHNANAYFHTEKQNENGKNCFCELKGSINDCSCNVDTVDYFNNNRITPRLKSLLVKDYFRFYKVNLKKDCPFWNDDDSKCAMRFCSVHPCEDKDIPEGLKGQYKMEKSFYKYSDESQTSDCNEDLNAELSYLNTSISQQAQLDFEKWADYDELGENYCILDDHEDGAEYVDLLLNPERYTGYRGDSAHRIWRSIYLENCFGDNKQGQSILTPMGKNPYNGLCMEQRAFYRLISGMHTSINIHLSANFLQSEPTDFVTPTGTWGRNLKEFNGRFSPEATDNQGPHWLKNLYFIYIIELRALAKAASYLRQEPFFTGSEEEDREVRAAVNDLLNIIESFPTHFNETLMFTGGFESLKLKSTFREKFRNISKIMDCVGCDKCRLWGKLQVQGLGTALKILFSGKFDTKIKQTDEDNDKLKLRRGEIVSLFNAFGRLSNSINELEEFRKIMR
ncbi:ero1-like protein [Bradysia coprophila]|uniref:ero1-like protein n=1 Tax=Bradysia coprophila TaxID=38358 RepID=UPI00187D96AE|nr:ero1-like protein [Bradysia coprophila]